MGSKKDTDRYILRLNSALDFDVVKERDIIKMLADYSSKHKLGHYICDLIRYAYEHPNKFKGTDAGVFSGEPKECNEKDSREKFFDSLVSDVQMCQDKVNEMYHDVAVLKSTAQAGNVVGLVEKSDLLMQRLQSLQGIVNYTKNDIGMPDMYYTDHKAMEKTCDVNKISAQAAEILINALMKAENIDSKSVMSVSIKGNDNNDRKGFGLTENYDTVGSNTKNEEITESINKNTVESVNEVNDSNDDLLAEFCGM